MKLFKTMLFCCLLSFTAAAQHQSGKLSIDIKKNSEYNLHVDGYFKGEKVRLNFVQVEQGEPMSIIIDKTKNMVYVLSPENQKVCVEYNLETYLEYMQRAFGSQGPQIEMISVKSDDKSCNGYEFAGETNIKTCEAEKGNIPVNDVFRVLKLSTYIYRLNLNGLPLSFNLKNKTEEVSMSCQETETSVDDAQFEVPANYDRANLEASFERYGQDSRLMEMFSQLNGYW